MKYIKFSFLPLLILLLVSCHPYETKPLYRIGVSQCCEDIWRDKMNRELNDELVFHPDLSLCFRQANDNSALQCAQIDSFIHERVDLLIVSPNEAIPVQAAVERAYDAAIPVIIADRRVPGNKWTAFVGGDNRQVGVMMAHWLKQLQKQQDAPIDVLEITGNMATTPAVMRHEGLIDALHKSTDIHIVDCASGAWTTAAAELVCDSLLIIHPDVDAIVTQSDLMAFGAAVAVQRHGLDIPVMGVDGLPGEGGGIEAVLNGRIAATAIYPSRGDLILQRAAQILHGEDFPRETNVLSVLVGPDEAKPLAVMYIEHETQMAALLKLRSNIGSLTMHYNMQCLVTWLLGIIVVLLIVFGVCMWRVYASRNRLLRERADNNLLLLHQQEMLQHMAEKIDQKIESIPTAQDEEQMFIDSLSREIENHMSNPELSVESLAAALGMSRSVLFRRTKAATGLSPVELIRRLRLQRANQLLKAGTQTIQQVAYDVGFSSAAYFAKCYREHYGISPGDEKKVS